MWKEEFQAESIQPLKGELGALDRHLNYVEMETVRFREAESSADTPEQVGGGCSLGGLLSQLQRWASTPRWAKTSGASPKPGGGRQAGGEPAWTHKPVWASVGLGSPAAALDSFLHGHFFFQ